MRRELLASVSAVALVIASASAATLFSDSAHAADLARKAAPPPMAPPVPVFSWTGCYVGAHVGWGWGHANHSQGSFTSGVVTANGGVNTNGALFGGQVGCNYQFAGNWVAGIQGDFAGTDFNGKGNDPFGDFDGESIALKTEWLASVTGRIGWTAWNNQALFYVKGGGAWIRNQWDATRTETALDGSSTIGLFSENRSGWTVGGGVEWMFVPHWSVFLEYNYMGFGSRSEAAQACVAGIGCTAHTFSAKGDLQNVLLGVNYKF